MGSSNSKRASIADGWTPDRKPSKQAQIYCAGAEFPTYNDTQFAKVGRELRRGTVSVLPWPTASSDSIAYLGTPTHATRHSQP